MIESPQRNEHTPNHHEDIHDLAQMVVARPAFKVDAGCRHRHRYRVRHRVLLRPPKHDVWRGLSNEASYEAVNTFDLRVDLGAGSFVERGVLLAALAEVAGGAVDVAEERLILPTQVPSRPTIAMRS